MVNISSSVCCCVEVRNVGMRKIRRDPYVIFLQSGGKSLTCRLARISNGTCDNASKALICVLEYI